MRNDAATHDDIDRGRPDSPSGPAGRPGWFLMLAVGVATVVALAGLAVAALISGGEAGVPQPRDVPEPTQEVQTAVRGQGSW